MTKITWMYIERRRRGLTQQELAEAVGVTQPRISAWETGKADIPRRRLAQLADILEIDQEKLTAEIGE